jgi:hypothetical protein
MEIAVPSGTFLLVRMSETLDTKTAQTGQIFTATLATNLAAQGYVVARQGTTVYGQVVDVLRRGACLVSRKSAFNLRKS